MANPSAAYAQSVPAPKAEHPVEVSVQYNLRLPLKLREVDEQRDVMEQGRKLLDQLAARECTLLTAAIGSSCELVRLNVSAHPGQPRSGDDAMTANGNAQFEIGWKQAN